MTKICFSINFNKNFTETDIEITFLDKYGEPFNIPLRKSNGKKHYDGTVIYTIDISNFECYDIIYIKKIKKRKSFLTIFLSNLQNILIYLIINHIKMK